MFGRKLLKIIRCLAEPDKQNRQFELILNRRRGTAFSRSVQFGQDKRTCAGKSGEFTRLCNRVGTDAGINGQQGLMRGIRFELLMIRSIFASSSMSAFWLC